MINATEPIICSNLVEGTENRINTPRMVTADMALVMDISGVCNSVGTREIRKYPTTNEKTNTPTINTRLLMNNSRWKND